MIGILEHMLRYPGAKDTVEGIQRWWLRVPSREFSSQQVSQALAWLATRGWIVESTFGGDTHVYGISPAGLDQATAQLERLRQ